ncbi:MAG: hypothetical protein CL910_04680 [Deltaproteobacteria bacterium]|nr:hypothetical protein [Deltaproteobacteria bacterium]
MKHLGAIAGRELRSLFVSPVAYAVLTLFAVLAGFFFLLSVQGFRETMAYYQQIGQFDVLRQLNLNNQVIGPFIQVMWIVFLFLIPGITMGLFANEKTNGTQELLMTSPLTMWELVLGKFLAAAAFVTILIAMMALFPALLFLDAGTPVLGLIFSGFDLADPNPEGLQMWAGLLGLWLLGLTYAAVGTFSSSLTRNQLVAFFLALALLLILWLLSVVADLGVAEGAAGTASRLSGVLTWLSTSDHFDKLARGLVDTRDLAYFVFMIGTFLVLTKTSVESVRWR